MTRVDPYTLALCSPATTSVFDATGQVRSGALDANIAIYADLIERAAGEHGARLVVFPQFGLTGFAAFGGDSWRDASVTFPSAEIDRLGDAARRAGVYAVVQVSEKHGAFPGRYFVSAGILTPEGEVGLVYRKNYSISLRTSPIDVYDRFLEVFGHDAFLPVLNTPIGGLGVVIGAEPHWPEPIRAMALKGAEVILNPIASIQSVDYLLRPGADLVRPVRAFENVAYFGMANIVTGEVLPQAWDFQGGTIAAPAIAGDKTFTLATIDIEGLRQARNAPAANLLAHVQPQLQENPRSLPLWPANVFLHQAPASADEVLAIEARVWKGLQELGRGKAPATGAAAV